MITPTGSATGAASSVWIRALRASARPRAWLLCFPHAGGTSAAYQPWARYFPADVALDSIVYPGREARIFEPRIENMDTLVERIAAEIHPLLQRPFALFGHSLGAAVAHEVACRLRDDYGMLPAHLFLSGRSPPARQEPGLHLRDDEALWEDLRRLGGTRQAVLEDAELREVMLPILRSDYRLSETYVPSRRAPLSCPITVFVGDKDTEVSTEQARAWRQCGCGEFSLRVFPGGHFYLIPQREALIAEILRLV